MERFFMNCLMGLLRLKVHGGSGQSEISTDSFKSVFGGIGKKLYF
jgi:hypothetical protein